jgi:hypothetical protein
LPMYIKGVDHHAVQLSLSTTTMDRSDRYCLNTSLIDKPSFAHNIVDMMRQYKNHHPAPLDDSLVGAWFDAYKAKICECSQIISKFISQGRGQHRRALERSLQHTETALFENPSSESLIRKRDSLTAALEVDADEQREGGRIRAHLTWMEKGERSNNKFFLSREKSRAESKLIREIESSDGKSLTSTEDILGEARVFFGRLLHSPDLSNSYTPTNPYAQE